MPGDTDREYGECRYIINNVAGEKPGMWVSRPGLGLETDQDHFFEVLVLVLASLVLVSVLVLSKT